MTGERLVVGLFLMAVTLAGVLAWAGGGGGGVREVKGDSGRG